jgi:L-iditol 2-dehydrogenase
VVGAGPIGLLVAQCARAEGAAEVVLSDTREDRLTLAAALGFPRVAAEGEGFAEPGGHAGHVHADPGAGHGAPGWGDPAALDAILAAIGERDLIDVAILCAGGPAAIAAAFSAVRPGGAVVALGLSGAPTIPFDFDGMVVRDVDLIGVLGSVGYWPDAIDLITSGSVLTEPLVTGSFPLERAGDALERLTHPGSLKVLVCPT